MRIREDDPRRDQVARLLREHLEDMSLRSPPDSIHALGIEALCAPGITFWTASDGPDLLGCGALSELDPRHGEIKSMRTSTAHRRKGVASTLLRHIIKEAERRGYERLSLETGSQETFAAARALYAAFGFVDCGPFGAYVADPNSVFMTRVL